MALVGLSPRSAPPLACPRLRTLLLPHLLSLPLAGTSPGVGTLAAMRWWAPAWVAAAPASWRASLRDQQSVAGRRAARLDLNPPHRPTRLFPKGPLFPVFHGRIDRRPRFILLSKDRGDRALRTSCSAMALSWRVR